VRAQFAECLGRLAGLSGESNCFVMGLFSLLDALLDRTIQFALQHIKLAPAIENVLLGTASSADRMAAVYALVRSYEMGDWDTVTAHADALGISAAEIAALYVESVRWTTEVTAGL
jgi:EAL and modified HD-GYP domain-containing signal transduction protein